MIHKHVYALITCKTSESLTILISLHHLISIFHHLIFANICTAINHPNSITLTTEPLPLNSKAEFKQTIPGHRIKHYTKITTLNKPKPNSKTYALIPRHITTSHTHTNSPNQSNTRTHNGTILKKSIKQRHKQRNPRTLQGKNNRSIDSIYIIKQKKEKRN